ncbi:MAG: hypothetical protein IJR14_09755, partial [Synergistaceae bacterium]|nr:hypothetical protein [Synergistaceae bacterium]
FGEAMARRSAPLLAGPAAVVGAGEPPPVIAASVAMSCACLACVARVALLSFVFPSRTAPLTAQERSKTNSDANATYLEVLTKRIDIASKTVGSSKMPSS